MIDELITETDSLNLLKVNHAPLSTFLDLNLVRVFENDQKNGKSYIRLVIIMFGNEIVTTVYADANQMKSEIKLFANGNELNRFFKIASLNTKSKKFKELGYLDDEQADSKGKALFSLTSKIPLENEIFIGIADAEAIVNNWNDAFKGYSMTRLIEYPSEQTLVSLSKLLVEYGYLK